MVTFSKWAAYCAFVFVIGTTAPVNAAGCVPDDIPVPAPFNEWLLLHCTEGVEVLLFKGDKRAAYLVSDEMPGQFNLFSEMHSGKRAKAIRQGAANALKFNALNYQQVTPAEVGEMYQFFKASFPNTVMPDGADFYVLETIGDDLEQVSKLIFVRVNGQVKQAVLKIDSIDHLSLWKTVSKETFQQRQTAKLATP